MCKYVNNFVKHILLTTASHYDVMCVLPLAVYTTAFWGRYCHLHLSLTRGQKPRGPLAQVII